MEYNFVSIEEKWQRYWREKKVYNSSNNSDLPKYYVLDMFPYPSGSGLHVGHPLGYIASDIISRYKRTKGFNVLHPMGFDSFGLPAEQYAIKTGQHPKITTENNIVRFKEQLNKLGLSYDWDREIKTSDSSYYKWTQWIFLKLYNSYFDKEKNKAVNIDDLKIPKILASRFLNPAYVNKFNLQSEIRRYQLIISIEKTAPFIDSPFSKTTAPWLLFNHNELYSRKRARMHFGLNQMDDKPLIVICGTGNKEELKFFSSLADELKRKLTNIDILFNSPANQPGQMGIWPLLKFIRGVDVLIGSGGYNLVHESRMTETQLFAFPQKRLYDNQFLRLTPDECCNTPEELIYRIEENCNKTVKASTYENGVFSAVKMIEMLQ